MRYLFLSFALVNAAACRTDCPADTGPTNQDILDALAEVDDPEEPAVEEEPTEEPLCEHFIDIPNGPDTYWPTTLYFEIEFEVEEGVTRFHLTVTADECGGVEIQNPSWNLVARDSEDAGWLEFMNFGVLASSDPTVESPYGYGQNYLVSEHEAHLSQMDAFTLAYPDEARAFTGQMDNPLYLEPGESVTFSWYASYGEYVWNSIADGDWFNIQVKSLQWRPADGEYAWSTWSNHVLPAVGPSQTPVPH